MVTKGRALFDSSPVTIDPPKPTNKILDTKFDKSKFETYGTGATRETKGGKGRYDLISPHGTRRLAQVYEKGAIAHGDNNWTQGMEYSGLASSAKRHIDQFLLGLTDEDHLGQAVWNLFAIMHFEAQERDELNDIGKVKKPKEDK